MDAWITFIVYMSFGNVLATDPGAVVVDLPNTIGEVYIPKNKSDGAANSLVYPIPGFMKYTPRKKHLKLKKLRRKMASDFDDEWMSIEKPKDILIDAQSISLSNTTENTDNLRLIGEVNKLNFSLITIQNGVSSVSSDVQHFKQWLLKYASCHVNYVWKDLSVLFWPRWVKQGYCSSITSCSWPPGMYCVASESKIVKLLRWNCRKRKRKNRRGKDENGMTRGPKQKLSGIRERRRKRYRGIKCKWIKIHYPLTQQCICSC